MNHRKIRHPAALVIGFAKTGKKTTLEVGEAIMQARNQDEELESSQKEYIKKRLPSDKGVVLQPTTKSSESFVPQEALDASEERREEDRHEDAGRTDPFGEERMGKNQPPVDSSEETLGG